MFGQAERAGKTSSSRAIDRDEYWLTGGWRVLRNQVLNLAWAEAADLLATLSKADTDSDEIAGKLVDAVQTALASRARASAFWAQALRLFPLPVDLPAMISTQRMVLSGEGAVAPAAAFKTLLRGPLEEARRTLLPGSPQRRKNWETIDRISRELFDLRLPEIRRCSIEHAREVAAELARRYPDSRNLRLSAMTVQGYFEDFLPTCLPVVEVANLERTATSEPLDTDELDLIRRLDLASLDLDGCIAALSERERELVQTVYGLDAGATTTWMSAQAFRQGRGLTRHAYDAMHRKVLQALGECLARRSGGGDG